MADSEEKTQRGWWREGGPLPDGVWALARGIIPTAQAFMRTEASSGIVLLVAVALALGWANSPWQDSYFDFWHHHFQVGASGFFLEGDLGHFVNDGLMTLFFFVVGLEIKRELLEGELAQPRQALLPVAGAAGGMAVPALLYAAFNAGGDGAKGWGIPMATDIAMAVGIMALLGPRVPTGLKILLLALAIVDDIGGILVIAIFYTQDLSLAALAAAGALLAAMALLRLAKVEGLIVYGSLALAFWLAVLESGVHATIAGVVLAMMTSAGTKSDPGHSPLDRMEELLHPWTSFVIVPVFALANAGLIVSRDAIDAAVQGDVAPGIFVGLVVGKPIGIMAASALVVFAGLASLPERTNWRQMAGAGLIAGVGFTVSLFISGLAFGGEVLGEEAKMGILAASVTAGLAGWLWLRLCCPASTSGERSWTGARDEEAAGTLSG